MNKALKALFLFVCGYSVLSASPTIDSLKKLCGQEGLKDFDRAIKICDLGMKKAISEHDSVAWSFFKRSKGLASYFKGDYNNAVNCYFEAIQILERQHNKNELAATYNELAKLYRKTKRLDLAEQTYSKAMKIYEALNDSASISMIYNESGVVFEYRKNYEEALKRYRLSLGISEILKDKTGVAYALNNIAGALSLQNKFKEASIYLQKALTIRKQLGDIFAIAINYSDIGMNLYYEGNYNKSVAYLDSSNQIAFQLKYAELLSHNFLYMSGACEKEGNYPLALAYHKKHIAIKDSVFTLESEKQISELNTKYQTEKKDFELAKNKIEIENHQKQNFIKNIIIFSILAAVILLAGIIYLAYRKKQIELKAKQDAEKAHEKETRTRAIVEAEEKERRRIAQDLHDGVGQILSAAKLNLSSLQSKLTLKHQDEIQAMQNALTLIDDSVKEVRAVSHNMMPNTLIKLGLASAVKEFITKIGNLPNLKVDLEIVGLDKRLDEQSETVLYRVIQEIVSNIIKHSKANAINLQLIKHDEEVTVMIEDNGIGFDTEKINEFSGIGLKNIISRIEFLNGTVHFDSTLGKGTNVIIEVPIS